MGILTPPLLKVGGAIAPKGVGILALPLLQVGGVTALKEEGILAPPLLKVGELLLEKMWDFGTPSTIKGRSNCSKRGCYSGTTFTLSGGNYSFIKFISWSLHLEHIKGIAKT